MQLRSASSRPAPPDPPHRALARPAAPRSAPPLPAPPRPAPSPQLAPHTPPRAAPSRPARPLPAPPRPAPEEGARSGERGVGREARGGRRGAQGARRVPRGAWHVPFWAGRVAQATARCFPSPLSVPQKKSIPPTDATYVGRPASFSIGTLCSRLHSGLFPPFLNPSTSPAHPRPIWQPLHRLPPRMAR